MLALIKWYLWIMIMDVNLWFDRYEEFLNAESRVNRKLQHDSRVHCCLYFLESNSHGMTPLDVEFMQKLHDKVNIIPIISKADTMTPDEVAEYKKQVKLFLYNWCNLFYLINMFFKLDFTRDCWAWN